MPQQRHCWYVAQNLNDSGKRHCRILGLSQRHRSQIRNADMAGSHGVYQKALGNVTVACFVKASHAEIYAEFGKIAAAEAL
jgi:hypothetical protein